MHGEISPNRAGSFPYEHEIIFNRKLLGHTDLTQISFPASRAYVNRSLHYVYTLTLSQKHHYGQAKMLQSTTLYG